MVFASQIEATIANLQGNLAIFRIMEESGSNPQLLSEATERMQLAALEVLKQINPHAEMQASQKMQGRETKPLMQVKEALEMKNDGEEAKLVASSFKSPVQNDKEVRALLNVVNTSSELNEILEQHSISRNNMNTVLNLVNKVFRDFVSELPRLFCTQDRYGCSMIQYDLLSGALDSKAQSIGKTYGLLGKHLNNMSSKQKSKASTIIKEFEDSITWEALQSKIENHFNLNDEDPDCSKASEAVMEMYKAAAQLGLAELFSLDERE